MACVPLRDDAPALSVIIPVWNGERYLPESLACLAAQTRRDFEVIVVDDGSTDGSAALVEAFAQTPGAPSVSLIRQANAGVSAARNRGIAAARAPLIGFLDCDDLWTPDKVAQQLAVLEAHPEIDLCFTGFSFIDGAGRDLPERSLPPEGPVSVEALLPRNFIHTSTVIVRRSALERVGGFDTGLSTFEDFELWLRIGALRDPGILGLRQILCRYRRHATQTTRDWTAMHDGWRATVERIGQRHPAAWARVRSKALAYNLEYCASLAWNSGDVPAMRALMRRALHAGAPHVLARTDGVVMTGILVCSYLPRRLQLLIGEAFLRLRRSKRQLETWCAARS